MDWLAHAPASWQGACVCVSDPTAIDGFRMCPLPRQQIRAAKLPAAVILGGLKRGVIGKRSEQKAEAARRNGCRPCRPGKKRGRPKGGLAGSDGVFPRRRTNHRGVDEGPAHLLHPHPSQRQVPCVRPDA